MARNRLSNVHPAAVSVVTKGANRQVFFMRKADETADDLIELSPLPSVLLKAQDDWSVAYCVVAEPGAEEGAGVHGDQSVPDIWDSEEEIQKACWRFAKEGGLVNLMHKSLDPYGAMVENAIALGDFTVTDPGGHERTIKKGSWYIAFEPSEDGKEKIESGEFSGVSLQGHGTRTLEKAAPFDEKKHPRKGGKFAPKGTASGAATPKGTKAKTTEEAQQNRDNTAANILSSLGGYKGMKLSDAVRQFQKDHDLEQTGEVDQTTLKTMRSKQKGARKKRKKVAKGSSADLGNIGGVKEFLRKLGEKMGLSEEDMASLEQFDKAQPTFADRIAQRELEDELPDAFSVLRDVIWSAFYPPPNGDAEDPETLIAQSLDEFKAWCLELLSSVPVSKIVEQLEEDGEWSLEKAQLSAAARKKLPKSAFVFPDKAPGAGSYPIHDLAHAKNAKARASGKPEEKKVFAAVHAKFPQLRPKKVAKADGSTGEIPKVGNMSEEHNEERSIDERMDAVEETLQKLDPEKIAEAVAKKVGEGSGDEGDEIPSAEDLSKKLDELTTDVVDKIEKIGEDVKKLGSGGSAQGDEAGGNGGGPSDEEKLAKALEDRKLPAGIAGII